MKSKHKKKKNNDISKDSNRETAISQDIDKKNRNQQSHTQIVTDIESSSITETSVKIIEKQVFSYEERLQNELKDLISCKNDYENTIKEMKTLLETDHNIYGSIKDFSLSLHTCFIDSSREKTEQNETDMSEFIFMDFENNEFFGKHCQQMNICYLNRSGNLHVCKENGIYENLVPYAASSVFLSSKDAIETDSNYILALEKIIEQNLEYCSQNSRYAMFCMLPESVDVFNTRIRSCLNTSKGKIISIPKSIAIVYHALDELLIGERICVIDLDGLHPVATQLYIGCDENNEKVIFREGFINNHSVNFDYMSFAMDYINEFQKKYQVSLSENEINRLVVVKDIFKIFVKKEKVRLFRSDERLDIIFDEQLFDICIKRYITNDFTSDVYSRIYVISSIPSLVSGTKVWYEEPSVCYSGLSLIRNKLLENPEAIIWKEKLPKISLEVIDSKTGRFSTVNLIDDKYEGQNVRLSLDEEIELPFKGTITLQKNKAEYYLPLKREIYSKDINSEKEAYFYDKSLPLAYDIPVELLVKYNYLSDSPIKIYARPKIQQPFFTILTNTWVEPHTIKQYSGPVYEGHSKVMVLPRDYVFNSTLEGLDKFLCGEADITNMNYKYETRGQFYYHKDFELLNRAYFQIRSTFDADNVNDPQFDTFFNRNYLYDLFEQANKVLNCDSYYYGDNHKSCVGNYKLSIANLLSNIVVASWYYDENDPGIDGVYEYLAKENKTRILIKLSRCIQFYNDDIYYVFEKLTSRLKGYFSSKYKVDRAGDQRLNYIRALSQNCWFSVNWMEQFYHTNNGPAVVQLIADYISDYLEKGSFKSDKEYRDVLEFLVCLTMARNYDNSMFDPNAESSKILLKNIKDSYEKALLIIDRDNLVSRLEMKQDQGSLYGYHNYVYMLIVVLSGEGQINLVGYHDD